MKHEEAKRLAARLGPLFPGQVTQGQAANAAREFRGHDRPKVEAAISEHRRTRNVIDWPALFAACAAPASEAKTQRSPADVYRRQCPHLAGASDAEVYLRRKRSDCFRRGATDGDRARAGSECRGLLIMELGYSVDSAREWAALIEAPAGDFEAALDDLRDHERAQRHETAGASAARA